MPLSTSSFTRTDLREDGAALRHAVADGGDLGELLDDAGFRIRERLRHHLERFDVVVHDNALLDGAAVRRLMGKHAAFQADAFAISLGKHLFVVHVDELVFERRAARIDNQYFHNILLFAFLLQPGPRALRPAVRSTIMGMVRSPRGRQVPGAHHRISIVHFRCFCKILPPFSAGFTKEGAHGVTAERHIRHHCGIQSLPPRPCSAPARRAAGGRPADRRGDERRFRAARRPCPLFQNGRARRWRCAAARTPCSSCRCRGPWPARNGSRRAAPSCSPRSAAARSASAASAGTHRHSARSRSSCSRSRSPSP